MSSYVIRIPAETNTPMDEELFLSNKFSLCFISKKGPDRGVHLDCSDDDRYMYHRLHQMLMQSCNVGIRFGTTIIITIIIIIVIIIYTPSSLGRLVIS